MLTVPPGTLDVLDCSQKTPARVAVDWRHCTNPSFNCFLLSCLPCEVFMDGTSLSSESELFSPNSLCKQTVKPQGSWGLSWVWAPSTKRMRQSLDTMHVTAERPYAFSTEGQTDTPCLLDPSTCRALGCGVTDPSCKMAAPKAEPS